MKSLVERIKLRLQVIRMKNMAHAEAKINAIANDLQ